MPYSVNVGDQMFPDSTPKLNKGSVYRTLLAVTEPYLVNDEWRVMTEDETNNYFQLEIPLDGWHVVGGVKKKIVHKNEKPRFKRGHIVQLRQCPNYPSLETHRAKLTGEPYEAFGKWQVPVKFRCLGAKSAIVDCSEMAFIGHSSIDILHNKVRSKVMKLSKPAIVTGVILLFLVLMGGWFIGNYNSLVTGRNAVDNSWAKVETQYQRRYDLIGNLVGSVKGAQGQELAVFTAIANARKNYASATSPDQQASAASQIETNVALIPKLQEAYPDLKSNTQVTMLMDQLTGTEDTILTVRNTYNDSVTGWNNSISQFPKNIFAGIFNFQTRTLFKADSAAAQAPKVDFSK